MAFPLSHRTLRVEKAAIALALLLLPAGFSAAEPLPSVAETLSGTPFSPKDARTVVAGKIAITPVDGISDRELVVGIACLMPARAQGERPFSGVAPMLPAVLVDQFSEVDPRKAATSIGRLRITPAQRVELRRYLVFEPGLGLNLSPDELEGFRALAEAHGGSPGAERAAGELFSLMGERVRRYREAGLEGIEPYVRAKGRLSRPSEELRRSLSQAHAMEQRYPEFFYFWNEYPQRILPDSQQRYFWIQSTIQNRPALILGHQTSWHTGGTWMMGERHFYISHFFNGGFTVAFVIPVQEGMLFALLERLWVDGYSGLAALKKRIGRRLLADHLRDEVLHRRVCPDG